MIDVERDQETEIWGTCLLDIDLENWHAGEIKDQHRSRRTWFETCVSWETRDGRSKKVRPVEACHEKSEPEPRDQPMFPEDCVAREADCAGTS